MGRAGYSGDNGPATAAELDYPEGVAVDSAGDLFIADTDNGRIREVASGTAVVTVMTSMPATHLVVTAPATAAAGSAFNFTVTAEDQDDNTATGFTGWVDFSSSDPAASLTSNVTLTNGVGTFSATLETPGNQTLTATEYSMSGSITGTSGPINVLAATHFVVSTPSTAAAGIALQFHCDRRGPEQ